MVLRQRLPYKRFAFLSIDVPQLHWQYLVSVRCVRTLCHDNEQVEAMTERPLLLTSRLRGTQLYQPPLQAEAGYYRPNELLQSF